MKEMMFEFLDNFYPHIRLLKTKFGIIPMYGMKANYAMGEVKRKHVKILCGYFSCDSDYGKDVYEQWLNSRPIYVRVKNYTDIDTFVLESESNNCVTFSN